MNCHNCNTPLNPDSNVCPNCGTLNGVNPSNNNFMIDLDDEEDMESSPQITENMAPPSLDVQEENLTAGVKDIGASNNISTYGETPVEETKEENNQTEESSVDIEIPKVQTPVANVDMPSDGSAPSIDGEISTVGEAHNLDVSTVKLGKKTLKIKMGKSKKVPQVILIGGIVVFFILGVLVGSTVFKQNVCVSTTSKNRNKTTSKINYVSNGKNNETKAGSYTYKIPQNYNYDKQNGGVIIYSDTGDWRIFIKSEPGLYDDLATARVSVEETLKANNVTVNNIKETKIDDRNYLIVEATTRLQTRLIAFTDAKNDHIFYIEVVTTDNTYNYDILKLANDIAKNATYDEKVSEIENIDVYDTSTMIITASEYHKSQNIGN